METRSACSKTKCGICFEPIKVRGKIDSCCHLFCFDCINTWAKRENSCPHCKLKFLEVQMLAEQCLKGKANVFSRNIRDNKNKTFKIGDRKQTDSTDDFDHDLWGQNMDAEQELHLLNLIVQIEEFMEGETDM